MEPSIIIAHVAENPVQDIVLAALFVGTLILLIVRNLRTKQLIIQRYRLIAGITQEFRKPFKIRKVFMSVLETILRAVPRLRGVMIVIFDKDISRTKLRVSRGMRIRGDGMFVVSAQTNKILQEKSALTTRSEVLEDDRGRLFRRITFFPLRVKHQVVGVLCVGYHRKQLPRLDFVLLKLLINHISLELADRLLQKQLSTFTKGLSLIEYSYEKIVDNLPTGVVAIDKEGRIVLFNKTMQLVTGLQDAVGSPYPSIFNTACQKEIKSMVDDLFSKNLLSEIDAFRCTFNGKQRTLHILSYPLFDAQDNVIAYIIMHQDITEKQALAYRLKQARDRAHKELQEKVAVATRELVTANQELTRLNKLKSEFVSTISHELKTPLTSIKGYIRLMLSGRLGDISSQQKESLTIVAEESDRLANLINDVLDLSRLESGKTSLKLKEVPLHKIIGKVIDITRPQAKEKGVSLTYHANATAKRAIVMDPEKIQQVLMNLVGNAIKFTPSDGKITVRANDNKEMVQCAISDTGIGISKQDQKHLFDPFYQVEEHLTRNTSGTGLGLTISRHIIELHKGTIAVESAEGKGTTVTFALPKELHRELKSAENE